MKLFKLILLCTFTFLGHSIVSAQKNDTVKDEIEPLIKELHVFKDQVKNYTLYVREYNRIVAGINGRYRVIAKKLGNGYTFVKEDKILQNHTEIANQIEDYKNQARTLYNRIDKDLASFPNRLQDDGGVITGMSLIALLKIVEKELKKAACKKAEMFYDRARWFTAEELWSSPKPIKWEFILDERCAKFINEKNGRN